MAFKTIFIYGGFGIVTDAVKAMTCIKIGTKYFRLFEKRIECSRYLGEDADIYIFASLIIIIITIIIPVSILLKMRNISMNKKQNSIEVIKSYNFLFQEYKVKAMFWEIVKIMLKYCIIVVINVFESNQYSKIQLALLFLVSYTILQINVQPYKNKNFNKVDLYSMFTCILTLINTGCISSTNNILIQNILIFINIAINSIFIIGLFLFFVRGLKFYSDNEKESSFMRFIKQFILRFQPYFRFKVIRTNQQFKPTRYWRSLKEKIIGNQGHVFIDYLAKIVNDNKLVQKQRQSMSLQSQTNQIRSPNCSIFRLNSAEKIGYASGVISPKLSHHNPFMRQYQKTGQIELISPKFSNSIIGQKYPENEDEVKNIEENFQTQANQQLSTSAKYILNSQASNKSEETQEECQVFDSDDFVKIYQSQKTHKASVLFNSADQNKQN